MENRPEPKFKKGDLVKVTQMCLTDNKVKTLSNHKQVLDRPDLPYATYFEKDATYIVKENCLYTNSDKEEFYHVLVEGSTQFVNENYFENAISEPSYAIY